MYGLAQSLAGIRHCLSPKEFPTVANVAITTSSTNSLSFQLRAARELEDPLSSRLRNLAMSVESTKDYIFADATPKLQSLALRVGNEASAEVTAADQSPVTKLTYTALCDEVTAEYFKAHHQVRQS